MPYRLRATLVVALTAAVALVAAAPPSTARAAGEKVAIIVGPVGGLTSTYRSYADEVAKAATDAGATVAKAYSPSATWAKVKAAVNGANVIVYFGHGNGYPNPYGSNELTDRSNGWGLNRTTSNGDGDNWSTTMVYCGEKALLGTLTSSDGRDQRDFCGGETNTDGISPAPNFTMVYAQAHYAPGFGERYTPETPITTLGEAQQRVRHYSTPILELGGTYLATAYGDADAIVKRVLTQPNTPYADLFAQGRGWSRDNAVSMTHPDAAGASVWVQRTVISGFHFGDPDFWYAFAGNPRKTPSGGTGTPVTATPPTTPSWPTSSADVARVAGVDRYDTAAAVSRATFAPGVPVAYVAIGSNFPDALAAGAAATKQGGPVLLVTSSSVPAQTATELRRLDPAAIRVVGGPAIISDQVISQLRGLISTGDVRRIAGVNRYATAAAISKGAFASGVPIAYIATGVNFPDALSGVAAAGSAGGPVLLTKPGELPAETRAELVRLAPGRIVVLGGTSVVADNVVRELRAYASVDRYDGANRYATAVDVSRNAFGGGSTTAFIATGATFPDALGGGPAAGTVPGPLLLVPKTSVPAEVIAELRRLDPDRIVILGGTAVVSSGVESQLRSAFGG